MSNFFLQIELSGTYLAANPGLSILLDGQAVAFGQVIEKTGSGTSLLSFSIPSSFSLSSLSLLFTDNSNETGRNISITKISVNNYVLDPAVFQLNNGGTLNNDKVILEKNESLDLDVNAIDFLFGTTDPDLSDLGTVTLTGTNAGEKLVGGKTASVIDGGDGDDEIRAGEADDKVFGGLGNDVIYGQAGNDIILGGEGNDRVFGREDNDLIYGGNGNDALNGGSGNDVIFGGAGQDKLYGESGNDILDGGDGNDRIYGQEGNDTLSGGGGNDAIYTGTGTDIVDAGDGDDKVWAEGGSNTLNGGAGNDVLIADNDTKQDTLNGGDGDDTLLGGNGNDIINGDAGNDRLQGGSGNDTLDGGAGDDKLFGEDGDDVIYGGDGAIDYIYGGNGNDTVYGGGGFDKILGDAGNDELHGGDDGDNIRGGDGDDIIYGDEGDDYLFGDAGNDTIYGGAGNDWIRGLDGADIIFAGDGDDAIIHDDNLDSIDGGAGFDTVYLSGNNNNNIDVTSGELTAINIEQISLRGSKSAPFSNSLTLSLADIGSLTGGGNSLYIIGDIGLDIVTINNLDLVNNLVGNINIGGIDYAQYQNGIYNLYIETGLQIFTSNAPIANDDNFTGNEDSTINGNVLNDNGNGADIDPSALPLSVMATTITTASGGSVTINAAGDFIYTPVADFYGTDSFHYTLQNTLAESDTGLVTLTVTGVNDGPTAQNDTFNGTKNINIIGDLLADNGNGADSDVETVILSTQAETITTSNGATVVINADGTFIYTPPTGFIGPDSFNYTLIDGDGGTDVGFVSIAVNDPNALPAGNLTLNHKTGASTSISDTAAVNTGGPYDAKTTVISFITDADITTRQVIYEQGGGTRGLNFYIENGQLHMAVWNYGEENWGYKEVTTSIDANTLHTASFIFDGAFPANGDITGYLDGVDIGSATGVGLLYGHSDDIGIGQTDGSTVFNSSSSNAANVFLGEVKQVVQYNEVLSDTNRDLVEQNLGKPTPVFVIEDVQQDTVPNDPAINNGGPYAEKTLSVAFTTGVDVTARQVIYEQGGTARGLSIYVEGGLLHVAAWNYNEENWGYKEVTAALSGEEFYTSTLVLDGTLAETGTLTAFLNGVNVGSAANVGLLYNHSGAVGVGELVNGTVFGGVADNGDHIYNFGGTIERIAQYNEALDGVNLLDLHSTMAGQNPNVTDNTFIGDDNDNAIGGGNGQDNIQGRGGNDSINGNGGNDTLRGEDGNDTLNGDVGDDFLYGGNGNDTLIGGTGLDVLYGDAGSDVFGFLQMDGNIDQIRDFTLNGAEKDSINITSLLSGYETGVDDINDFVILNYVNSNRTDIRIDADGTGSGESSEVLAIIRGSDFLGTTVDDLIASGQFITDTALI